MFITAMPIDLTALPPDFDAETYYWLNPDVRKAGMDAAEHFLQFGFRERRRWRPPDHRYDVLRRMHPWYRDALANIPVIGEHAELARDVQARFGAGNIEDIVALAEEHSTIFQQSPTLSAIMAMTFTVAGQYEQAQPYLDLLAAFPGGRALPFVELCEMTCQFFRGECPTSPVSFEGLHQDVATLPSRISRLLPPLAMIVPVSDGEKPIVFVACDSRYFFEHALPFIYSVHRINAGQVDLHVHLYSPNPSVTAEISSLRLRLSGLTISVSTESVELPFDSRATYFASVRFIRAYEVLARHRRDVCIIDADSLFNRPWATFEARNAEIALASSPTQTPFWEHVVAGFSYFKATPRAEAFLAHVSQFILPNLMRGVTAFFGDQIALSVCAEREPAAIRVPIRTVIDIQQDEQALVWTETVTKGASPIYAGRKRELCALYGQREPISFAGVLARVTRELGKVFFLQIGAADGISFGDPIHEQVKAGNWHGILVEPLPDMMAKLKANYQLHDNLVFENVAITEANETRTIYRVPIEAAQAANLPDWVLGMSTFVQGKLDPYLPHVVEQFVPCITLPALLARHAPERIDVLQVDTEGYDYRVINQFNFERYQPIVVNFEYLNLSSVEKSAVQNLLLWHGYVFYENGLLDLFAVRRDFIFTNSSPDVFPFEASAD